MHEASKTNRLRGGDFTELYLRGRVIDIGCGADLVKPDAEPFDTVHGDANEILRYREASAYDAVHSSHCLEHMIDVPRALSQWWSLLKPRGYLVLVVPDEDLYEQGIWPSVFNGDHKATFRCNNSQHSWSPVSYSLPCLLQALPNCEIVDIARQDAGYVHEYRTTGASGFQRNMARLVNRKCRRYPGIINHLLVRICVMFGVPIDQTMGDAVAQIQAIARKRE